MSVKVEGNPPVNVDKNLSEQDFDNEMEKIKQERRADQLRLSRENREINYVNGLKSNLELIR